MSVFGGRSGHAATRDYLDQSSSALRGSQFFALIARHSATGGKSGGVVCLRMSSATRRRHAPKRPRVRRYSISSSAYALWPPLRLWPFSPARHFKDITRRLVDRRGSFQHAESVLPARAWRPAAVALDQFL